MNKTLCVVGIGLILSNPLPIIAIEGEQLDYAAMEKVESKEYTQISKSYSVASEGVSYYYYNTVIQGVRYGEHDVQTSTQDVPGLGEDLCVGRPLDNNTDNTQYACVVLPYELSDEYGRGDIVYVRYDDVEDSADGVYPCIVIDFKQQNHEQTINFVGEFTYSEGDTAWLVGEK